MMHVVIITPGFPVNEKDTSCIPFLQLYILELIRQQIKVTVITEQHPATENYKWHGVEVYTLSKKEPALISRLLKRIRLTKLLSSIHKRQSISALHNFWFSPLVMPVQQFAVKHCIKHVTTFAGQDVLNSNKALRSVNQYKGDLICVSQFQKNKLQKNVAANVKVIGLGIDPIPDRNTTHRSIDLIFAGWISPLKNYTQFIEIVAELNKKTALQKVVMCGGGEGMEDLKENIKHHHLGSIIELTGTIDRGNVIALMRQSKILVHTSTYESYGLVLAEALACGCHVVSKPVGIAYEHDEITACGTTEEFVFEISKQLSSPERRELFSKPYSVEKMAGEYMKLYKQ